MYKYPYSEYNKNKIFTTNLICYMVLELSIFWGFVFKYCSHVLCTSTVHRYCSQHPEATFGFFCCLHFAILVLCVVLFLAPLSWWCFEVLDFVEFGRCWIGSRSNMIFRYCYNSLVLPFGAELYLVFKFYLSVKYFIS